MEHFSASRQANRLNGHIAVWTAAAIFSLVRSQMFGFVPRLLLGAFFGYALWWTNSLRVPVQSPRLQQFAGGGHGLAHGQ